MSQPRSVPLRAARRFVLLQQGLLGGHRFAGKEGALRYVGQCGCIQFDPVNVCGRNAELTLNARVKGFTPAMLHQLLYTDRALFDYPDKEIAILRVEDWPYFARWRNMSRAEGEKFEGLAELEQTALKHIREAGPTDARSLPIEGRLHWYSAIHWSGNWHGESDAARSVLEQLYASGELAIHHKDGARKCYDLAERCIAPELLHAPDPLPDNFDHLCWGMLRRIGAAGLMWNRRSDAWLGLWDMDAERRNRAFVRLTEEGKLLPVQVEGLRDTFYLRAEDAPLLEEALSPRRFVPRCEALAPLDPMLWDRRLVRALFDFAYSWEIYTPPAKRRYGAYVLPLVWGERLIGRVEAVADTAHGVLTVRNRWLEDGVRSSAALEEGFARAMARLARMNGCAEVLGLPGRSNPL